MKYYLSLALTMVMLSGQGLAPILLNNSVGCSEQQVQIQQLKREVEDCQASANPREILQCIQ